MSTSVPIVDLSPQVRDAFDEGCLAVFKTRVQRPLVDFKSRDLLLRFAAHYQQLGALPRRLRRTLERRWKCTLSAIALLMTLGLTPAWAARIEVSPGTPTPIRSDGRCSLSEAIVNANANGATHRDCAAGGGIDTILLPPMSQQLMDRYTLPTITSRIVIEGRQSTIRRDGAGDEIYIKVGASGDLTLNRTTVTGVTGVEPGLGYAVFNEGFLTLDDCSIAVTGGLFNSSGVAVLKNSSVTDSRPRGRYYYRGSGILNLDGGTLVLTNSVVAGNAAFDRGGGIDNDSNSTATLVDSAVSQNRILFNGVGGGISNSGTLTVVDSTVSRNLNAQSGGGIANDGTATVMRSTISGNRLSDYSDDFTGGGISNSGTLIVTNSTVSNNVAQAHGGGVTLRNNGFLTIESSTVTGNVAESEGAGVFVESGTVRLRRSIVSGNTAPTGREIHLLAGAVVAADEYNLFGHDGDAGVVGFTPGVTDIVPNDPIGGVLLPLADNGGDTRTHALAIGSPALDVIPSGAGCPSTDQRGQRRFGAQGNCDIGSFEGSAVICNGRVTTMVGTDGPDALTGTAGADVISGLSGDDDIAGLGGNDLVCAGGGADSVFGSSGNDVLFGQGGNDRLFGHAGNDTLNGGAGQDQCDGGTHTGAGDTAAACETISNVP